MRVAAIAWLRRSIRWIVWMPAQALPLPIRKRIVAFVGRQRLPVTLRFEFAMGMLEDLRRSDPDALHRFLWSNHLAYAASYEVAQRFGESNINPSRRILFRDLAIHLRARGLDPEKDIASVLELGCSQGYLLRHLETSLFRSAGTLHGLDLDAYAIQTGAAHLQSLGSKVALFEADMAETERVIRERTYDVVLCCGVLMYVNPSVAEKILRVMFARTARLVGLICLAEESESQGVRTSDGAFLHRMPLLIDRAGGRIVSTNRVGRDISGSSPSDVIVAEPR